MYKNEEVKELEEKIGYEFKDKALIMQALTHSSFSNEQKINKYKSGEFRAIKDKDPAIVLKAAIMVKRLMSQNHRISNENSNKNNSHNSDKYLILELVCVPYI